MRMRNLSLIGAVVAVTVTLAACGGSSTSESSATVQSSSTADSAVGAGDANDITFAQLMIPHHQQAVQMADIALAHGVTGDVKTLAEQIKGAQDPEIEQMTAWLAAWGAPIEMAGSGGHDGHDGMDMGGMSADGMMSDSDMMALDQAQGTEFDTMWLTMMIQHHEGAITMAQQVLATTSNAEVRQLADAVVSGQTAEIDTMKGLLGQ